jgi:hypothetical protein
MGTVKGPLLVLSTREGFDRVEILALGCGGGLDNEFDDELSTRYFAGTGRERKTNIFSSPKSAHVTACHLLLARSEFG